MESGANKQIASVGSILIQLKIDLPGTIATSGFLF
jgi:hypothetical protein